MINPFHDSESFHTPGKHQKNRSSLMFSGVIERASGMKWVNSMLLKARLAK